MNTNKTINQKILAFQQQNISLKKDGTNPHFKSSYVTLNEVLDKVVKPLNDLGCVVLQIPEATGLRTQIINTEDDTKIECFMSYVDATTAQKLGSCNTYLRRYSLITLLGLEDSDDDGELSSDNTTKPVVVNKSVYAKPEEVKFTKEDVDLDW